MHRTRKKFTVITLIICFLVIFTSCSSKNYDRTEEGGSYNNLSELGYASEVKTEESRQQDYGSGSNSSSIAPNAPSAGITTDSGQGGSPRDQKIIKNGNLNISALYYDEFIHYIKDTANNYGGYVESSNTRIVQRTENELKEGSIVLRVPSENFDVVMDTIQSYENIKVVYVSENENNVTNEYYDTEARMKVKLIEEERLLAMIDKAAEVEDLFLLEERLSEVRAEIEIFKSSMINIDRSASFSTIQISVQEETKETIRYVSRDLGSRMAEAFAGTINFIINAFEWLLVFLAGAFIPLLVLGILVFVGRFAFIKTRHRK